MAAARARYPATLRALAREVLLLLGASIFLAMTARISVPLPFTPVPITGQTLGVLLIGALYGPRRGPLAVLAYIAEGLGGAPVFAGGRAGLGVLLGPTGGYLVGFVFAAALAGALGGSHRPAWLRLAAMLGASALIYVPGVLWLAVVSGGGLGAAVAGGMLPFLPGDVLKAIIAAGVTPAGALVLQRGGVRPQ